MDPLVEAGRSEAVNDGDDSAASQNSIEVEREIRFFSSQEGKEIKLYCQKLVNFFKIIRTPLLVSIISLSFVAMNQQ